MQSHAPRGLYQTGPSLKPESYDAVIVGAGVFGAWTAYHLVHSGARVLLIDQHGPGNARSSSGGETRIIRLSYGPDEVYTRSSMRSLELWKKFIHRTKQPFFHETGVLVTSNSADPYLLKTRETLARVGCTFDWLDYYTLRRRFPHMKLERDTVGVYEPKSGVLFARRSVQAVVDAAVLAGARYKTWRSRVPKGRGKVHVLRTSGGEARAEIFIFACGPWLPTLFPKLLAGCIRPTRQEVFFFGTPPGDGRFGPPDTPAWIAFREGAYSVPALDGRGFKLAVDRHGPQIDPETGSREITRTRLAEARAVLRRRFPALGGAPLIESRVCQYENTGNGDFLIDRHPGFENVWIVGGGSGHGFKHGPAVGRYVTTQIQGAGAPEPRFSLANKKMSRRRTVF